MPETDLTHRKTMRGPRASVDKDDDIESEDSMVFWNCSPLNRYEMSLVYTPAWMIHRQIFPEKAFFGDIFCVDRCPYLQVLYTTRISKPIFCCLGSTTLFCLLNLYILSPPTSLNQWQTPYFKSAVKLRPRQIRYGDHKRDLYFHRQFSSNRQNSNVVLSV